MNASPKASLPDIYEDEECMGVLERFNCRSRVCTLNAYSTILELARQELFQEPYLMMQRVLEDLRRHALFSVILSSQEEVLDYYGGAKVTTRKSVKIFRNNPGTDTERKNFKHLVQLARTLSDGDL